jgi:hypothetical protein
MTHHPPEHNAHAQFLAEWRAVARDGGWLSYHLAGARPTPFGLQLLGALDSCEERIPGLGRRLINALAHIRCVSAQIDAVAWRDGYQQLLQTLAEILVLRAILDGDWPADTAFAYEPHNPETGRRPELSIETDDRLFLIEVKCPRLLDHQARRGRADRHVPARGIAGDGMRADQAQNGALEIAWPRDNPIKDFLESAETKFAGFPSAKPISGVLVIVWDDHFYEPISSLRHPESGLFTEASFARDDNGDRLTFSAVDGVVVIGLLNMLSAGTREELVPEAPDPFTIDPRLTMPNVWCANGADFELDTRIAVTLNALPLEDLQDAAEYRPQDLIFWHNMGHP